MEWEGDGYEGWSIIRRWSAKVWCAIWSVPVEEEIKIKASGENLLNPCCLLVVSFTPRRYFEALYASALYSEWNSALHHLRLAVCRWPLNSVWSLLVYLLTSLFLNKILIVWSKRPSSSFPGVCQIASDPFSYHCGFSWICIFLTIPNCWEFCAEQKYLKWHTKVRVWYLLISRLK